MYNQEVKQHCRRRLLEHAIKALTTERSSSVCVQRDNVRRLWEKLDKTEKAKRFPAEDCEKIEDEIRKWERFHDSQVQEKKASDLRVCYLSGDDPTNDLEVLVENGVLCQNVWAIEKNSNILEKVLRNVANSNMRNIRLFNGDLLHFLKEFEGQFDIIYCDACGSLPSAQKTLKVIGYIFLYHKLTSPGALITNFSFPCDEIQRTKTMDRSKKYMEFRKKNTKYEQRFFDTDAYSDYITFQIMDSAYLYIPANRMLSSEKKSLWDQIFEDKGEFNTKAEQHEGLIYSSLWLSLLLDKMCETSRYKTWVNEIFPDGKFEKKLIIFMHQLSQDVEIFAKLGSKYLEENFQEMSEILPCECFGGMRDLEFKRHFLRLVAQLLYGQMAYPSFSVINKSLRLTYTAKQQQMFADVFIFDKCRYLYDQFPSVLFCHLGIKEPREQMVFRMVADCLQKHIEYVYSDVFEQCHLPTVEPPFEGGTDFRADCKLYIPEREVLDFKYFKENGNKLEKEGKIVEAIECYNACQEVALKKNMLKELVLDYSKKVLNLDQNNVKAMFMRSIALKELKQFEEAVENLETICYKLMEDYKLYSPKREVPDFDKEQPAQLEQVESILEKKVLDLEEEGDKMVEKVIESYTACQEICLKIDKQNSQNKVLHYAKKVLVLDSKNAKAMQVMAFKALTVEKVEQDKRILEEVLHLEEEKGKKMVKEATESYIACQKICFKINKQDSQEKVISYGKKVLVLDSNNVTAMCMQAMAFKVLGEFKEAVKKLEISYKLMEK